MSCEHCKYGVDYGESVKYIKCERKRKIYVEKNHKCENFKQEVGMKNEIMDRTSYVRKI